MTRHQNQSETKQGRTAGIPTWGDVEKNMDVNCLFPKAKSTERTAGGYLLALKLRLERFHHSARGGKRIDWRRQHSPIPKHHLYTVLRLPRLGCVHDGFSFATGPMAGGSASSEQVEACSKLSKHHMYSQQRLPPVFSTASQDTPGEDGELTRDRVRYRSTALEEYSSKT